MLRKASAKGELPASAKLTSQKERGAQSLAISTVDGWLIGEEQDFVIFETDSNNDIVPGSATSWKGVPASNGSIAGLTLTGGLDRLYPIGAAVVPTATSAWANDLIEWLLKSHNPDGTLKESAIPELKPQVIPEKSITADKIDSTTILSYKNNNSDKTVTGSIIIQSGWIYFLGNGGKQQSVQVTFPKKFKEVYAVIPVLIGYTFKTPTSPESFDQKIGAGTNIECGAFNQTGTTITASTSGIFGGANHGISWIAIGTV